MQQSFRVLQEWERLREEIRLWRGETLVAEPVDLGPILNRCERLERRYVSLGQVQKQHMEHSAAELEKKSGLISNGFSGGSTILSRRKRNAKPVFGIDYWKRIDGGGFVWRL